MKTIKLPTEIKEQLDQIYQDKSINKTLDIIFDGFDDSKQIPENKGTKNINISDENWERLNKSKAYATEPYASVIHRLIETHQK